LQENANPVPLGPRIAEQFGRAWILVMLVLGIFFTTIGIVSVSASLTSAPDLLLILGVVLLVISFGSRHGVTVYLVPGSSTMLALYVAVEFLAGALVAYSGIANLVFDSEVQSNNFVAVTGFGLLLVSDSLLYYRRSFRQVVGKNKRDSNLGKT